LGQFPGANNFRYVKRKACTHLQRLNPRLLQLSRDGELIVGGFRIEIKRRWFKLRPSLAAQIAHLQVEARVQVSNCSLAVERRGEYPRCHRSDPAVFETFRYVEFSGLKCHRPYAVM